VRHLRGQTSLNLFLFPTGANRGGKKELTMTEKKHHQRRRLRQKSFWKWFFKIIVYLGQLTAFFFRIYYDRE